APQENLPARVADVLREEARAVARNLAEVRGLMNQVLRRLEHIERDAAVDRHARVDDLSLLVDLVSSGWKGVDARLARMEEVVGRLEQGIQDKRGAIVYRIEDRRPDEHELAAPFRKSEEESQECRAEQQPRRDADVYGRCPRRRANDEEAADRHDVDEDDMLERQRVRRLQREECSEEDDRRSSE